MNGRSVTDARRIIVRGRKEALTIPNSRALHVTASQEDDEGLTEDRSIGS